MKMNDKVMVMPADDVPRQKVAAGTGATLHVLIGPDRMELLGDK